MSEKKKNILKISLIIICILAPFVAWVGFGEQGLIRLYHTELERQAFIEKINHLTEENQVLLQEIERLRSDEKYIESMARKQFNMLKQNEVIYRFGEKNKDDGKCETLSDSPHEEQNHGSKTGNRQHGKTK